jgi:hypothetical protein
MNKINDISFYYKLTEIYSVIGRISDEEDLPLAILERFMEDNASVSTSSNTPNTDVID